MFNEFLVHVLAEVNSLWLSIALLSMLFLFFLLKVKFQKKASVKAYGILFYAFVFYSIASISYVLLNALNHFFHIDSDIYSHFWWFFPLSFLAAAMGALLAWVIYLGAHKVAKEYEFQLMNYSLLIIAPYVCYTLLLKPFYETISLYQVAANTKPQTPKNLNFNNIEELNQLPDTSLSYLPAIPSQLYDSILVQPKGAAIYFVNNRNGFSFTIPCATKPIHQIYVAANTAYKQLAVLALAPAIQQQASFLVIDSLGMLIFEKTLNDGTNRLSLSENGKYAVLQEADKQDSLVVKKLFLLKP